MYPLGVVSTSPTKIYLSTGNNVLRILSLILFGNRLIPEDDNLQVHYTVGNSREYKELPLSVTEVPLQVGKERILFILI